MAYDVSLSWQVKTGMRSLNPVELERVNQAIDRLREGRFRDEPRPYKVQIHDGDSTYIMAVDDSLLILFKLEPDRIDVQDMMRREFAEQFK